MKKYTDYAVYFVAGAIIYTAIEILWRGRTHWTMGIAGGICLMIIHFLRKICPSVSLITRCITGAVVICTVEFLTGFFVNIVLSWNVWNYSDRLLNICGQICPTYAVLWFLLCIPANSISSIIEKLTERMIPVNDDNNV